MCILYNELILFAPVYSPLKEQLPIKNIEFDAPSEKLTPQKFEGRNLAKFRSKLLRLSRSNLSVNQNQTIKNIFVFNKIRSKNILIKNKILKPFIATIHNNLKDVEKINFPNSFSCTKNMSQKCLQINCMNKNSQTEKPEIVKLEPKKIKKENIKEVFLKHISKSGIVAYYIYKKIGVSSKYESDKPTFDKIMKSLDQENDNNETTKNNNKNNEITESVSK